MEKRISLGIIISALLILGSIQMVFFETVESNESSPNEDYCVGTIWNSELDVSSYIMGFDDISIAHVNASDRVVLLPAKNGNLTVGWTVSIASSSHPEYFAAFSLFVYNIDDNNTEIGNDTFMKTYNEDSQYDENGILKVALDFSGWIKSDNITLLCELGASFMLNKTREAKNFTSVAQDRCVAVVFLDGLMTPQPKSGFDMWEYRNKTNYAQPCMWSWIDGWEKKFEREELMLNNQTYFQVGWNTSSEYTQQNEPWWLGLIDIYMQTKSYWSIRDFIPDMKDVWWEFTNGVAEGQSWMNYSIDWNEEVIEDPPPVAMRYHLLCYERWPPISAHESGKKCGLNWFNGWVPNNHRFGAPLAIPEDYANGDETVLCMLVVWARPFFGIIPRLLEIHPDYRCHIVEEAGNEGGSGGTSFYWEEDAAYSNSTTTDIDSYTIGPITYVEVDITPILVNIGSTIIPTENEIIYTSRGDTGDTRITITC